MELTIKNTFKNELEFFKIYDNFAYIIGGSFDLEFLLVGINDKYYAISRSYGYCISQIENTSRDAKEVKGTRKSFDNKEQMSKYLMELINTNEVIQ